MMAYGTGNPASSIHTVYFDEKHWVYIKALFVYSQIMYSDYLFHHCF